MNNMGKLELLNDTKGTTSTPRVVLFLWTLIPLGLWVYFSFAEGRMIPLTELSGLDLIIAALSAAIGFQYIPKIYPKAQEAYNNIKNTLTNDDDENNYPPALG